MSIMAYPPPNPSSSTPLAPGFRFHPTDEELVGYYLRCKVAGVPLHVDAIADVELYRRPPWELPPLARLRGRDRQWFFFGKNDRKYDGSLRANRATAEGFWKSTGKDRPVLLDHPMLIYDGKRVIGMRKSLVFHIGRAPNGRRTDWVMHEYRLEEDEKTYTGAWGAPYVVCRIFQKGAIGHKKVDEYGAPLLEEEWTEEEAVEAASPAPTDVLMTATAGERENGHSDDFEQGTIEIMHSIDRSTFGIEASSSHTNPSSEGILAPGFRFYPTDEELVYYYLKRKVSGLPLHVDAITEVNVYKWAPWDLPAQSRLSFNKLVMEWYFFSTLDRKYVHNRLSHHNNRATAEGYWKSTGNDRPIRSRSVEKIIGMKKTLVFHAGRSPHGRRTDWVMHEYRLEEDEQSYTSASFVLCRIFEKSGSGPRKPRALLGAPFLPDEWEKAAKDVVPARRALPTLELPRALQWEPFFQEESKAAKDLIPAEEALLAPDFIADVGPIVDIGAVPNVDDVPNVVLDAVREPNHVCTSDNCEQRMAEKLYIIGDRVEIAYIREKLPVAWYTATVIKVLDQRILLVEYESLKAEDDTLLSEIVSAQYIRPQHPASEDRKFDLLDEVEAFYNDGWWPGVIAKVNAGSCYNVKFMHWEEEIEFKHMKLRLLYDWVDGQWIQASQDKPMELQHHVGPISVQQLSLASNSASKCSFPSSITPCSCSENEAPSENYGNENSDRSTDQSQPECSPTRKKAKKGEEIEDNTRLLDSKGMESSTAIDVRTPIIEDEPNFRIRVLVENCSTSPLKKTNVVSGNTVDKLSSDILSGQTSEDTCMLDKSNQEVVLFPKPPSIKREENPKCGSGKPELLQAGPYIGDWCPMMGGPQRKEPVAELHGHADKGARQLTAGERMRKNCRPLKLTSMEPSFAGDYMGHQQGDEVLEPHAEGFYVDQGGICTSDNGSEAQGPFNLSASSSDASLGETSASSVQPGDDGSEAQNKVLPSAVREQPAQGAFTEREGDSPHKQSSLPFEKCSPMWDSIESMEAFYLMRRQPHFRPLSQYCKDFREGMALGLMVTFCNAVNSVGKLEIAGPRNKFDGILKTLVQLEANGFDVQRMRTRVLELMKMKEDHDRLVDERDALKAQLRKENKERELLDLEIESIKKSSRGLEQSQSCILEMRRETSSKLDSLEMDSNTVEDAILSCKQEFEAIRSASWS